jgi:hypothetical protein
LVLREDRARVAGFGVPPWTKAGDARLVEKPIQALTGRSACSSTHRQPIDPRFRFEAIDAGETRGKRQQEF